MSIPNVENCVMTLSEEKGTTYTHTHRETYVHLDTHSVFTLAIPSSGPQQTAGLWGVLTRSVCMCVYKPV